MIHFTLPICLPILLAFAFACMPYLSLLFLFLHLSTIALELHDLSFIVKIAHDNIFFLRTFVTIASPFIVANFIVILIIKFFWIEIASSPVLCMLICNVLYYLSICLCSLSMIRWGSKCMFICLFVNVHRKLNININQSKICHNGNIKKAYFTTRYT